MKNLSRKIAVLILLTVLISVSFTACNRVELYETREDELTLYVNSVEYFADKNEYDVKISVTAGENAIPLDGVKAAYSYDFHKKDYWYNEAEYVFTLDGATTFSAVRSALSQNGYDGEELSFSRLIITFDYVTLYKSAKSGVEPLKDGKYYTHGFAVAEDKSTTAVITRETPYTAAWYSILIVCGLGLAVIAAAAMLAFGGKYGRRNKKEEGRQG